ncbi:MAG: hypothetical protein WBE56_17900, partial [Terracidiphilus sp.]
MRNYFNYFTEIEERFQKRRGSLLLLSTLDWALIETWREAGIPLDAALRGIDAAFDKYESRQKRARMQRINGLAWCAQAVMQAAMELNEAAIGSAFYPIQLRCAGCNEIIQGRVPALSGTGAPFDYPWTCKCGHVNQQLLPSGPFEMVADAEAPRESGFEHERVAAHLTAAADALDAAVVATEACEATASRLRELAAEVTAHANEKKAVDLEGLERSLTVLEDKLFAALRAAAPEDLLVRLDEHATRELAPYRSRMGAVQLRQVKQQFTQKQLLVHYNLPRLSLFY